MLPKLAGVIARRILVNFRADPDVIRRLLPWPLEVATYGGYAVAGICLTRLEGLRPQGVPGPLGIAAENMAHRVAIRYPTEKGWKDGIFIWRRESDCELLVQLGGCLFPGVHHRAGFEVWERNGQLALSVRTDERRSDVVLRTRRSLEWRVTPLFPTLDEMCGFFELGDCAFSCVKRGRGLEGLRLRALRWELSPLRVTEVHSAFYENHCCFPPGSVCFDSAVLIRDVPHDWHELPGVPECARAVTARMGEAVALSHPAYSRQA
jgi:hypothetical protein